eukprot:5315726-Alexandrium_andersonii.AAC.1
MSAMLSMHDEARLTPQGAQEAQQQGARPRRYARRRPLRAGRSLACRPAPSNRSGARKPYRMMESSTGNCEDPTGLGRHSQASGRRQRRCRGAGSSPA